MKIKIAVLSLLVSFFALFASFYFLSTENLLAVLYSANLVFLVPVILIFVLVIMLNAFSLKILIDRIKRISFKDFFFEYTVSWSIGNLLPGKVGDLSLLGLIKKYKVGYGETLGMLFIDKAVTITVILLISIYAVFQISLFYNYIPAIFIFLVFFAFFAILAMTKSCRGLILKVLPSGISGKLTGFSRTINNAKTNKKLVLYNFIITLTRLCLQIFIILFIYYSLGSNPDFVPLLLIYSLSSVISYIPVSINGLGIREGSFAVFAGMMGLNSVLSFGAILIMTFLNYIFVGVILFIYLFKKVIML